EQTGLVPTSGKHDMTIPAGWRPCLDFFDSHKPAGAAAAVHRGAVARPGTPCRNGSSDQPARRSSSPGGREVRPRAVPGSAQVCPEKPTAFGLRPRLAPAGNAGDGIRTLLGPVSPVTCSTGLIKYPLGPLAFRRALRARAAKPARSLSKDKETHGDCSRKQ